MPTVVGPTSSDGITAPVQIPGTELWVVANQSAKSVVQVIGNLLRQLAGANDKVI